MRFRIWKREESGSQPSERPEKKKKGKLRENIEVILSAILIAVLIRVFLVDNYEIPSGSMIPTMLEGDRLFVSKFNYGVRLPILPNWKLPRFDSPDRGSIVIFQYPNYRSPGWVLELLDLFTFSIFGLDPMEKNFVKRTIGLPGDHVRLEADGSLWVNGQEVPQTFYQEREVLTRPVSGSHSKYEVTIKVGTNIIREYTRHGGYEEPRSTYLVYREGPEGDEYLVQYQEGGRGTKNRPFPPRPQENLANFLPPNEVALHLRDFYQEIKSEWLEKNMLQSSYYQQVYDPKLTGFKKVLAGSEKDLKHVETYSLAEYQTQPRTNSGINCLVYAPNGETWYRIAGMTNLQPLFANFSNRLCVVVPKDHYFVMGDNRDNSSDSRVWGFLHKDYLMGSPLIRYLPLSRFGTMD